MNDKSIKNSEITLNKFLNSYMKLNNIACLIKHDLCNTQHEADQEFMYDVCFV